MPGLTVVYCQICSLPPEYCEFGPSPDKCKVWLNNTHPNLYANVYGNDNLSEELGSMSLKDAANDSKPTAAQNNSTTKKKPQKITIKREARTKRKSTVSVCGLHLYDVELKKAAKLFSSKFACGSSVTKNNQGQDEIVVQGDVEAEIEDLILSTWSHITPEMIQNISK